MSALPIEAKNPAMDHTRRMKRKLTKV